MLGRRAYDIVYHMRSKGRGARDVNGLHRFTRSARSACVASVVALVGTVVGGVVGAAPAVAAGAPTQTVFTVQPPTNVVAGTSFTVEVAIEDSSGNVVTSDSSDSVNLGIEQGPSQLHCTNFGSATVSAGIADFTCSLDTASSAYELYASSPYGFINSNLFAVTAAAPAELSLVMPSVVSAGLPFTASAQMEDAFGNVETTDSSGTVTLSLASGPGGALTCTPSATVPVSSGVANFSCSIGQAGDGYELRATDSVYSFSGSGSLAVNAAPSLGNSKVAVSPNPTILSSDGVASFSVTVTVEDASGNPVVGDTVSLSFNPTGELSFYPPVPQETPGNGVVSWQVTCNAGSCAAGSSVAVTATDTTANLVLGTVNEDFVAADVRTPLGDLTGWAGQQATVSLQGAPAGTSASVTFDGSTVSVSGVCTTDASGGLSQARDTGDCTFTVPVDPNVGSEVPVVISVGNESYTLQFALVSPPTINLSPTSGQAGAVITVSGSGFPADLGTGGATALQVTFTPAGATASSTTANCDTDGTGAITTGTGGTACQLTVPAATPVGAATVAVTGFATATAGFTVTATCATDPAQAACTMTGISIDTGALHNSRKDLYVGETVTLPIDAVYSDGTSALLPVPAGGPYPQVVFTDSAPSGAVAYGGLDASNNGLDINATLVTTSPANIAVTYDGFSAGASVGAETEPCGTKCAFVNGALLTVQAVVPGALGTSTPVSGAVVQITQPPAEVVYGPCGPGSYQNTGCTPVSTLSGATVLSSSTCTTGDNGTDTGDPGQCQVTDAEYGPDWVTLSPPPDYTITGVSGCTNTGATDFECELQPQDFNPETVTFDLQAYPTLTVKAGGPFDNSTGNYDNDLLNGVTATITGPSLDLTCVLEGGQPTTDGLGLGLGGTEASCQVQVAPGTYNVSVGSIVDSSGDYSLPIPYDNSLRIYVTSTDPASEQLNAGDTKTVSFTTAYEPLLQVQVAGPEEAPPPGLTLIHNWDNQDVNGAVVSFSQGANTVATCTLEGGVANFGSVGNPANEQASCQAYLPPGSYAVSVGSQDGSGYYSIASTDPHGVSPFVDVTSTDPLTQELNPGDINSASFTTAFEPQLTVNLGGPEICPNSGGAPGGPCLPMNSSWYNSEVNGTTVNITPAGSTTGTAVSCQVEGGQDTVDSLGGQAASCTVVVPPGTYNVQVPSPFNLTNSLGTVVGTAYVTSTNPQSINVKPGDQASVSFNSGAEPLLTVDVGGPEAPCDCVAGTAIWDNESVNGAVVMVSNQALGPWAPLCTVSGGSKTDGLVDGGGQQASCTTALPPGTYDISVGSPIFTNPPVYGNIATVTGLDDQVVTLSPGDAPTISFSTAWGNMQNVGTGPGSATTTDGLLSATGTGGGGTGTVTVGEYNSDPEGTAPAFASSDHYFDVMVSPDSTFASLTFTECGLQSGDELDWWDPNAANGGGFGWWEPVSPASAVSWSADGTCATVTITGSTYPDLAQMTGTVFAVSSPGPTGTTPAQAQTLNFDTANPSPVRVGGFYTPRATASSGLAVAFSIDAASSPGACTINDSGIVGFIGTGTCVVDANQGGGSGWQPAQQVQQAITVLPASSHVVVGLSGPKSAKSGKPFTYTLTVANDGPDAASNLAVSLQLGKETQILSASGSPSQQGGGPVDWSVAALWPGRSLTYTVSVSVTSHSPETLVAVATAVPQGSVDPDPSQETARATTRLTPFGPVTKGHRSLHPMRKVKKTHLLRKSHRAKPHRAKPHRAKPHRARKSKGRPRSGAKASAT